MERHERCYGIIGMNTMSRKSSEDRPSRWQSLKRFYIRQFLSLLVMLVVIGFGLLLRESIPWLKENIDYPLMLLLSGLVGILVPNITRIRSAGREITRDEESPIGTLASVAVIFIALVLVSVLLTVVLLNPLLQFLRN